jgi:AcrR family transcriptional regulator
VLAQKTARKQKGRPAGSGAADIRQAILDSAEALFARKGYAATSLREIADEVNVNPAMVHYYFGSKRALLQQVLECTLEPLAATIAVMKAGDDAPISEIVRLLLRTFSEHPSLPALVVREVMLPGGVMQDHFLEYLAPRLGGSVPDLLKKEQSGGRMKLDLDPRISALIIISLCVFPFVARELAEPALGISYDEDGLVKLELAIHRLLNEGFSA